MQRKRLPGFCPSVEPHDRGRLLSDQTAPRQSVVNCAEPGTLAVFKAGGVLGTAPLWFRGEQYRCQLGVVTWRSVSVKREGSSTFAVKWAKSRTVSPNVHPHKVLNLLILYCRVT